MDVFFRDRGTWGGWARVMRLAFLFHLTLSVFWVFFSVLRKLGAKWRNVEGKLDRPGVVLRYVNSKTSNPRNQRRVYIEKSSRPDDYKSFYLDTPEGPSPNAFGQMQFAIIVSQSKTSASLNTSVYF